MNAQQTYDFARATMEAAVTAGIRFLAGMLGIHPDADGRTVIDAAELTGDTAPAVETEVDNSYLDVYDTCVEKREITAIGISRDGHAFAEIEGGFEPLSHQDLSMEEMRDIALALEKTVSAIEKERRTEPPTWKVAVHWEVAYVDEVKAATEDEAIGIVREKAKEAPSGDWQWIQETAVKGKIKKN
jgi:hypothetical protein